MIQLMNSFLARLKQPSTIIGVTSAVLTLAASGLSSAPAVVSSLLAAFGLVVVNA